MKKLILSALVCSSFLFAESKHNYELTPMIGLTDEVEANRDERYGNIGIALGRNLNDSFISQIELAFLRSQEVDYKNSTESTNINRTFLNAIKDFPLNENFSAYGLLGFGYQDFTNEANGKTDDSPFGNYGLGIKYHPKGSVAALRADARHMITTEYGEDSLLFTLGLVMPLGKETSPKKVVTKPVLIEKKEMPKDSDKDGVTDANDMCKNTLAGVKVDSKGCELDSDKDGVVDSKDMCKSTLMGLKVSANGCELDSDNDGIVDSKDMCKQTVKGATVDSKGCEAKLNLKINFDSNSSVIRQKDMTELENLAKSLKANDKKIVIEAHTDSLGSAKYNLNLSKKRAASAKQALVNLGVDSSRIEAIGYGEANPIANNETKEGREENRRITVIFK